MAQKRCVLRGGYKAKNTDMTIVCISVQYLVKKATVLKKGFYFRGVRMKGWLCTYQSPNKYYHGKYLLDNINLLSYIGGMK